MFIKCLKLKLKVCTLATSWLPHWKSIIVEYRGKAIKIVSLPSFLWTWLWVLFLATRTTCVIELVLKCLWAHNLILISLQQSKAFYFHPSAAGLFHPSQKNTEQGSCSIISWYSGLFSTCGVLFYECGPFMPSVRIMSVQSCVGLPARLGLPSFNKLPLRSQQLSTANHKFTVSPVEGTGIHCA